MSNSTNEECNKYSKYSEYSRYDIVRGFAELGDLLYEVWDGLRLIAAFECNKDAENFVIHVLCGKEKSE